MKEKILFALVLASAMAFAAETKPAEEQKYVDPNPYAGYGPAMRSTAEQPLAVNWSKKNDAALAAATADEVLAALVADEAAATALLAKVGPAYSSDPIVLTQIAAVTQWVMLPDPWYCLFWDGPHAAGRAVWKTALAKAIAASKDDYVRTFCRQQLDLCE